MEEGPFLILSHETDTPGSQFLAKISTITAGETHDE